MSDRGESPLTGKFYVVKAVCDTLDVPRFSFYKEKCRKRAKGRQPVKCGPVQTVPQDDRLALIHEDLASCPFTGEGYRKVWAYGFAAFEPVTMGVTSEYGTVDRDASRDLAFRMDYGIQYLSDHFQNQIESGGIAKSLAFFEQLRMTGAAERFLRTLPERAIYGRVVNAIEDVRQAVADFVQLYSECWLTERKGYLRPRPLQAREATT